MAEIIDFTQFAEAPDPDGMSREELLAQLERVRARMEQLDEQEPEDMNSEAYEIWGSRHEALEDLADEIQDLLDEMGGPDD